MEKDDEQEGERREPSFQHELQTELYLDQKERWPTFGQFILAQYTGNTTPPPKRTNLFAFGQKRKTEVPTLPVVGGGGQMRPFLSTRRSSGRLVSTP